MKLEKLFFIINKRKKALPDGSYVVSLIRKGENKILQKIGEEAIELIIAGKEKNRKRIIEETADLLFFMLVFLAAKNISLEKIFNELERRRGR